MNKNINFYKGIDIFNASAKEEIKNSLLNPYGYNLEGTSKNEVNYDEIYGKTTNNIEKNSLTKYHK